jgi:4-amino-4-deoxy-L-arabinose transferase-like glycosyltransferase
VSEPVTTTAPGPVRDTAEDVPTAASGATARRRVPGIVWWVTSSYVVFLLFYSILLPTYRGPDEALHVDLAHRFSEELHYPAWDEAGIGAGIRESLRLAHARGRAQHLTTEEALPKGERPSLEELAGDQPQSGINQLTQHPPLYYVLTGGAMRTIEAVAGGPVGGYDMETWVYRLMNVAMLVPVPLIIWHSARLLRLPAAVGVAAMLVPLAIPQFTHIGSKVNNDNLMVLLFCALTPVVIRIAGGDLRIRTAVVAGLLTGLGMLTKGFGLLMPFWVAVALILALRRRGRGAIRTVVVSGAVYGVLTMATGGWWWVRNVVLYGKMAPSRFDQLVPTRSDVTVDVGAFAHRWAFKTTERFWAHRFGDGFPGNAVAAATFVAVALIVLALARRDRVASTTIGDRVLLLVPLLVLIVNTFYRALEAHERTGQYPGMQGRYWFGALAAVSILMAIGLANLMRPWLRWVPLVLVPAIVAMQSTAAWVIATFHWEEPGSSIAGRVRALVAWAPHPGELIGIGAVVGAVVLIGTVVQLVGLGLGRTAAAHWDDASSGDPAPA